MLTYIHANVSTHRHTHAHAHTQIYTNPHILIPMQTLKRKIYSEQFNFVVSGPNLENRLGTLRLLNLILALVAVLGALYMIVAFGELNANPKHPP